MYSILSAKPSPLFLKSRQLFSLPLFSENIWCFFSFIRDKSPKNGRFIPAVQTEIRFTQAPLNRSKNRTLRRITPLHRTLLHRTKTERRGT